MVHFLLSSLSCFLMGSDKFCSSIIAKKLWAIEPKRFSFSMWIIVNEPIQCSPSNVHVPRPCYSLIWAKLLSSVKRTRKYGWPLCNLMLTYFYRLFFFRTIHFLNPKNKTVIVQNVFVYTLIQFKWQLCISIFKPFLAIFSLLVSHKTEVQTVILRCLTGLNLEFWKYDSWFPSDVSKLTSVWNKLNLSLKYWCIEARLVFCTCYGPKKLSKCHLGTIQTTFSEDSNYYRGNIGENLFL